MHSQSTVYESMIAELWGVQSWEEEKAAMISQGSQPVISSKPSATFGDSRKT